jgi:ABC-type bacteriocin/lantibiotic exporter with double-glycine peptidase domain
MNGNIWTRSCVFCLIIFIGADIKAAETDRRCGARSLHAVLNSCGIDSSVKDLELLLPRHGDDSTLAELAELARQRYGLHSTGLRWDESPPLGTPPAIIPIAGNENRLHFVTVVEWGAGSVRLQDGNQQATVTEEALRSFGWDGTALHLSMDRHDLERMRSQVTAGTWSAQAASIVFLAVGLVAILPGRFVRRMMLRRRSMNVGNHL